MNNLEDCRNMWIDEEVSQNDENFGKNLLLPKREECRSCCSIPDLSVINYSILNISLKFIFIFTFNNTPINFQETPVCVSAFMFFNDKRHVNLSWGLERTIIFNGPMNAFAWLFNSNLYIEYGQHVEKWNRKINLSRYCCT